MGNRWTIPNRFLKSIISLVAHSAGKEPACNVGDPGSIPRLGRSPGEGNSYPLQYSGLENSMDCIVHGVANSQTQLSDFHFIIDFGQLIRAICWGGKVNLNPYYHTIHIHTNNSMWTECKKQNFILLEYSRISLLRISSTKYKKHKTYRERLINLTLNLKICLKCIT